MTDTVPRAAATLEAVRTDAGTVLRVTGRLDVESTPELWRASRAFAGDGPRPTAVDASGVESCDSAGAAWLLWIGAPVTGANAQVASLLDLVRPAGGRAAKAPKKPAEADAPTREQLVARIGHVAMETGRGIHWTFVYIGSLAEGLLEIFRRPKLLRRKDLVGYMLRTGPEALPIVALINFLVGVIIAFQSYVQIHRFGADRFVADAVAVSFVMELGALMTAIIMAGRSGSAFAAEIGTMKVNEEVDALDTMGLDSTRFLVMPKFVALLLMMPLLVTFACFCGILGGMVIGVTTVGLPTHLYLRETVDSLQELSALQVMEGLIKGEFYAVVIAAIGCLRGLQTKSGAQGVGLSATSAVVTGLLFIILVDAALTVLFRYA
jgi:phospholipid/cholesterol/gamma-HCH transport system permease protein